MLSIDKERGEIKFSYHNSDEVPVQGTLTYFQLNKDRIAFTLTGQTAMSSVMERDIGMLLAALGQDLVVEAWKSKRSEVDGPSTDAEAEKTEPNGPDLRHTYVKPDPFIAG
jgi:hypothetical protein